ncbi:hypothetical protein A2U01_0015181 [Trifolium medium]|uniref:Uncharacterized protein n=1 Tax=Trifolium medium TaxID=97028 RepID=A0A392N6V5_9FABA|nr:hypothetical protein [Trifolium medium]
MVGSLSNTSKGTTCEDGFTEGRADVEFQRAVEEESLRDMGLPVENICGPAHDVVGGRACYSDEGGCELEGRVIPQILRTRNGDLSLCGPNNSGPPILLPVRVLSQGQSGESIESFGDQQVVSGGAGCNRNVAIEVHLCSKDVTKKKKLSRKNFTDLPLSMLRKLPGSLLGAKRGKNRRGQSKNGGGRRLEIEVAGSDPIFCPDSFEGDGLEVGLPGQPAIEQGTSSVAVAGDSGLRALEEGGGFIVEDVISDGGHKSQNARYHSRSREVSQAKKLIAINEDLGLQFHDGGEVDVDRMVDMEMRDREEANVWVNSSGYQ